jgi:hypothetical protein
MQDDINEHCSKLFGNGSCHFLARSISKNYQPDRQLQRFPQKQGYERPRDAKGWTTFKRLEPRKKSKLKHPPAVQLPDDEY